MEAKAGELDRPHVVHFSTVHPRFDTRIRVKELSTLSRHRAWRVSLFVQDGGGDEFDASQTLRILDTGSPFQGRIGRMSRGAWRMFLAVRSARPSIAHFHDPELIPVGLLLKMVGIKVIYDVHEDVPRQILGKYWLWRWIRKPIALAAAGVERLAGWAFDGIVTATPTIRRRFPEAKTVTVQNFPIDSELVVRAGVPYGKRPLSFAYVGAISASRGVRELVQAIGLVQSHGARLQLAGCFRPCELEEEMSDRPEWAAVEFHGWTTRSDVARILGGVRAGLVVLHPTASYPDALPVKMFEYMAAGLPVIASDFPLWREIVEEAGCGLLVDPLEPEDIANAMEWVMRHPAEAEAMGQSGREAVERKYTWGQEAVKLISLYERILGERDLEREVS